jgi:predicted XRE-type DNA-binding protein
MKAKQKTLFDANAFLRFARLAVTRQQQQRTRQPLLAGIKQLIEQTHHVLPRVSQETLAEMIGTTRSRVNFFMNKFKKLGFIEYKGGLKVNHSLLTVVMHD